MMDWGQYIRNLANGFEDELGDRLIVCERTLALVQVLRLESLRRQYSYMSSSTDFLMPNRLPLCIRRHNNHTPTTGEG